MKFNFLMSRFVETRPTAGSPDLRPYDLRPRMAERGGVKGPRKGRSFDKLRMTEGEGLQDSSFSPVVILTPRTALLPLLYRGGARGGSCPLSTVILSLSKDLPATNLPLQ